MHKFRNEEGLTLIELLITLAVIAVVFAIAVPVFSNVLAVAEADAAAAQQAALDSFAREYATTTLSYDSASNTTTATLNGDVIATIKGDATSAGSGNGGGNAAVVYTVGTDFTATFNAMGMDFSSRVNYSNMDNRFTSVSIGNPSPALKSALKALVAGDIVTVNGVNYTVRSSLGMDGQTTYVENYMGPTAFLLYIDGANNTGTNTPTINVTEVTIP